MELRTATEEQQRERDRATFSAWGSSLDLTRYLERERRLRRHPWAREVMRTWLLHGAGGGVLSSCETFRLEAFHRSAGGEALRTHAYGVASVFTEPHLRGHGHASRLLQQLHQRLQAEDPSASAVVLFSDVGEEIYARLGYVARPAMDWILMPLTAPRAAAAGAGGRSR